MINVRDAQSLHNVQVGFERIMNLLVIKLQKLCVSLILYKIILVLII